MGKPTGFLEYERETGCVISPEERIQNFNEFHIPLSSEMQQKQGARCMDCGVPFCQSGMMIGGMVSGCPLNNLVPEWNDLIYNGNWEQAWRRLMKTNSFPEFTSRVCPALLEFLRGKIIWSCRTSLCISNGLTVEEAIHFRVVRILMVSGSGVLKVFINVWILYTG